MKHIAAVLTFIFVHVLSSHDQSMYLSTILTPVPLIQLSTPNTGLRHYLTLCKNFSIPLTYCFYLNLGLGKLHHDIINNPYSSICIGCTLIYYSNYIFIQHQQQIAHQEIIDLIQELLPLVIISYGLYNKIHDINFLRYKNIITINYSLFSTLQLFLQNISYSWSTLFSYYQKQYPNKTLYAYHLKQISSFEMTQACTLYQDLLPHLSKFYDKNNSDLDIEPILNSLGSKLHFLNNKINTICLKTEHI